MGGRRSAKTRAKGRRRPQEAERKLHGMDAAHNRALSNGLPLVYRPQQRLNFLPLPQGHGSLRPAFINEPSGLKNSLCLLMRAASWLGDHPLFGQQGKPLHMLVHSSTSPLSWLSSG